MRLKQSKKQIVLGLVSQGKSLEWISSHENVTVAAVRRWVNESLFAQDSVNISSSHSFSKHLCSLSPQQIKWIQYVLFNKSPKDFGFKTNFWTGTIFDKLCKNWCKKVFHVADSYKLFSFLGFEIPKADILQLTKLKSASSKQLTSFGSNQLFFLGNLSLYADYKMVPQRLIEGSVIFRTATPKRSGNLIYAFQKNKGTRFFATTDAISIEMTAEFFLNLIEEANQNVVVVASKNSVFASKRFADFFERNFPASKLILG